MENKAAVTEEELARAREYCKQLERQNIDWTSGTIIWQLALYARQEREAERERIAAEGMTPEVFEWMDAALRIDTELHGALKAIIPSPESLSLEDREHWQVIIDTIFKAAAHADVMPHFLKDRAPRKGMHNIGFAK